MKKPYWWAMKPGFRRSFAEVLRLLADKVADEDAFCATGIHFYFKNGVGKVIEDDEGIRISPPRTGPGVRCWYRRSEYDDRRFGDEETGRTLTAFHDLIRQANEKP